MAQNENIMVVLTREELLLLQCILREGSTLIGCVSMRIEYNQGLYRDYQPTITSIKNKLSRGSAEKNQRKGRKT